ncbi:phosphopantetheinyl transferase [Flavobacterium arsenatis]|uniref:Phosphopantetheinyl transferase n=1 Tax=Flavobacterium arsenatis TaxID=1484332 RepID=A0ABU1TSP9_9FLAO|nr:4'-phosphopantetheinyl transferase superfamily protein [Flavobacterium arsenatis]MDR6968919.1 phosphopantetheinyl transferase [Flavobacterium arsenatis]
MPLHETKIHEENTKIYIWKITETFEDLFDQVLLNDTNLIRLNNMKSELHQRGFLSVRMLLQSAGYSDNDLYYDEFGKPHLADGKHISITHSFGFSAIIISNQNTGIDIEMQREKITLIADKFIDTEFDFLEKEAADYIRKLTVIWGVKESIFKIQNEVGISFKDHISVFPFELEDKKTSALLTFANLNKEFKIHFMEIEDFTLVYAFEKN